MWFVGWIILAIIVGALGSSRKIGFGMAFLWSILLSPLIGVIITLSSKTLESVEYENKQLELQKEQTKELKYIASKNSVQQIKEAKELLDSGAITEDEFNVLKKQILDDLSEPASTLQPKENMHYAIGQLVVEIKTETQMRIKAINSNGLYTCTRNGVEIGSFCEDEIIDFDTYVKTLDKIV